MNTTEWIDFSPISKSLPTNTFLNCQEEFSKHDQHEEQKQTPMIGDVPTKIHKSFDELKKSLQRVTELFIVEGRLMNTIEGFIDQRLDDDLCERVTQQLLAVLRRAVRDEDVL